MRHIVSKLMGEHANCLAGFHCRINESTVIIKYFANAVASIS